MQIIEAKCPAANEICSPIVGWTSSSTDTISAPFIIHFHQKMILMVIVFVKSRMRYRNTKFTKPIYVHKTTHTFRKRKHAIFREYGNKKVCKLNEKNILQHESNKYK